MRPLSLLALVLWPSVAFADGLACFEKASGKWLGEYCTTCEPGICLKNWVTTNPQLSYTSGQIEERRITDVQEQTLMDAANKPSRDDQAAKALKHQALLVKLCQGAGLLGQDLADCQRELR